VRAFTWAIEDQTVDDTRKFIEACQSRFQDRTCIDLGIYYKPEDNDGLWIGYVGLHGVEEHNHIQNGEASIGYWVDKPFNKRGIATDAARWMMRFGFQDMGLSRIIIECSDDNEATVKIAEKIGLKKKAGSRPSKINGRKTYIISFTMSKGEWTPDTPQREFYPNNSSRPYGSFFIIKNSSD